MAAKSFEAFANVNPQLAESNTFDTDHICALRNLPIILKELEEICEFKRPDLGVGNVSD